MSFENITIGQVREMLQQEDVTLVDIRDRLDFQTAHIDGAQHVNNDNVAEFVQAADLDKPLVIYCYHGHSSQSVAQYFSDQGFEHCFSMIGGFTQWQVEG